MPKRDTGPSLQPDINLTPMIDITLVILIILMAALPQPLHLLPSRLPSTEQDPGPPPVEAQLVVALYADGTQALNREQMEEPALLEALAQQLAPRERKQVFVDAAATVSFQDVVAMVGEVRGAGATRVGLARMKPDGPALPR